jgi:hypothetical protein
MATTQELLKQIQDSFAGSNTIRDEMDRTVTAKEGELKQQYGVGEREGNLENLRKSVYDTTKVLRQLPKNVTNRVRGRLMTEAQRNRLLSSEQNPLTQQVQDLSASRDVEQQGLSQVAQTIKEALSGITDQFGRKLSQEGERRSFLSGLLNEEMANERQRAQERLQTQLANIQAAAMQRQLDLQRELANLGNKPTPDASIQIQDPLVSGAMGGMAGINLKPSDLVQRLKKALPTVNNRMSSTINNFKSQAFGSVNNPFGSIAGSLLRT